jgi:hypothetical protein
MLVHTGPRLSLSTASLTRLARCAFQNKIEIKRLHPLGSYLAQLFLLFGAVCSVGASLQIQPEFFAIEINPKQTKTCQLTFKNTDPNPVRMDIRLEPRLPDLFNDSLQYQAPKAIEIPGHAQKQIPINIMAVRPLPGELQATLFVSALQATPATSGIAIETRLAIPLYFAPDAGRPAAEISEWHYESKENRFSAAVHNTGGIHLTPFGIFILKNSMGTPLYQENFSWDEPIQPSAIRSKNFTIENIKEFSDGMEAELVVYLTNLYQPEIGPNMKIVRRTLALRSSTQPGAQDVYFNPKDKKPGDERM